MSIDMEEFKKIIQESGDTLDLSGKKIEKFTPEMVAIIESKKQIEVLILSSCELSSLQNFPKGKYQGIDLSDNKLSDESNIQVLCSFPQITQIFLNSNKIREMSTIMKLKVLKNLVDVDFTGNPVASHPNYPQQIFNNFPSIELVDQKDKDGVEVPEEDEQAVIDDDEDDDEDEDEYEEEDDDEFSEEEEEYEEESYEKPNRGRGRGRKPK